MNPSPFEKRPLDLQLLPRPETAEDKLETITSPVREMPLKQWCIEEGLRCGLHPVSIWYRLRKGQYPDVRERIVNKRVILVRTLSHDV